LELSLRYLTSALEGQQVRPLVEQELMVLVLMQELPLELLLVQPLVPLELELELLPLVRIHQ
jgi:hypothetical protein